MHEVPPQDNSSCEPVSAISLTAWRRVCDALDCAFLLLAPDDSQIIECNRAAHELFGYGKAEFLRFKLSDLGDELTYSFLPEEFCSPVQCRCRIKNGESFSGEIFLQKIDLDGTQFLLAQIHDLSRQKQLEAKLKHSEELSRVIQRLNKIGSWEYEIAANKTFWTEEMYRIHDLEPSSSFRDADTVIAETLALFNPEDMPLVATLFRQCVEEGVPYIVEARMNTFAGHQKWVETRGERIVDDNGEYKVVGYMRDITESKQQEEIIRKGEEKYKTILQTAIDGFWITDLEGRLLEVNDGYCRMSGYSEAELLTMDVAQLEGTIDSAQISEKIDLLMLEGAIRFETMHRRKDGSLYDVEVSAKPLDFYGNKLFAMLRDISAQKEAEKENRSLQAQLLQAQKMEAVGRLAGGVAHDFNNMLGVILGQAELALLKTTPEQPLYAKLHEIIKASERSADIARQLLAFASQQPIEPKRLDLNEVVSNTLKMVRRLIGEDITLIWTPGQELCPIKMDPAQLDQIFINLCVNARDAVGDQARIVIETDVVNFSEEDCKNNIGCVPGEFALLSVSDNGCGMDKKTLENIFEPFFTTKGPGKGTGLGLATVYGIVKQNSGFINVFSEPGKGTTFRIYLPSESGALMLDGDNKAVPVASREQETVLVVEDESTLLNMAQQMIESLGYRVLAANSPGQAQTIAREYADQIDLLVTDVIMPEMTGLELVRAMEPLYPKLKYLFMSGYTADIIAPHGILVEGIHYIQKPFTRHDLSVKLREALAAE